MPRVPARPSTRGIDSHSGLSDFAFQLVHVAGRGTVDGDFPGLHGLGNFSQQIKFQQPILEYRVLHLNVIGQAELPLELPRGNTSMKIFAFGFVGFIALDGDDVLLGGHRNLVGRKAGTASEMR
jgi:hypothetical protein